MNRKTDPIEQDFQDQRTNTCAAHSWFAKMLQELTVTVQGNGSVESKKNSLVGITSSMSTTLKINGIWLRGLAGLLIALFCAAIIPVLNLTQESGRVLKRIEINTEMIHEHDMAIKELKEVSYGYQDSKKVVDHGKNRTHLPEGDRLS